MGKLLEALDRNKYWKVFRHAKAAGDIFDYFGGWIWLSGFAATACGAFLSHFAALPGYGKALVGLVAFLVVLLIALVGILIAGSFTKEAESENLPSRSPSRARKLARTLGAIAMPMIVIVAALMSVKPRTAMPVPPRAPSLAICSPALTGSAPVEPPDDATKEQRQAYQRDLIRSWRFMISQVATACPAETFTDAQVSGAIQRHPDFQTLKPHLSQETDSQLVKTTHFFYGAKLQSVLMILENDVDRIEREWRLVPSPRESVTSASAPKTAPVAKTADKGITVGNNSVAMGHVPGGSKIRDGSVVIGPTGDKGNVNLTQGGLAVGKDAIADQASIAIGADAHAGVINSAPGGIANSGTIGQATVINAPPRPNLHFTVDYMPDADSEKHVRVHVSTDRSIPGAIIGLLFSDPVQMDGPTPILKGAAISQFSWTEVARAGVPIPNSMAVIMNAPAAFLPGQDLMVPIKSRTDIHVLSVGVVGN